VPGAVRAMMPVGPRYTSRTCWPAGDIVMTVAAPATAATRSAAAVAPAAAARSTADATVSKARTSWPAATRLRAIGKPMFPNPIKPILAMSGSRILGIRREFEVGSARTLEIARNHLFGHLRQRRRPPPRRLVLVDDRRTHALVEISRRHGVQRQAVFHAHGR